MSLAETLMHFGFIPIPTQLRNDPEGHLPSWPDKLIEFAIRRQRIIENIIKIIEKRGGHCRNQGLYDNGSRVVGSFYDHDNKILLSYHKHHSDEFPDLQILLNDGEIYRQVFMAGDYHDKQGCPVVEGHRIFVYKPTNLLGIGGWESQLRSISRGL